MSGEGREGGREGRKRRGEKAEIERDPEIKLEKRNNEKKRRKREGERLIFSSLGGKSKKEKWSEVSLCAGVCECGGVGRLASSPASSHSLPNSEAQPLE